MSRIHCFLIKLSKQYSIPYKDLLSCWENLTCPILIQDKICGKPSFENHIQCEFHSLKKCSILLQGGPNKHKMCNKAIMKGDCCKAHQGLKMCSFINCLCTTQDILCIKHEKEKRIFEKNKIPIPKIRVHGEYFKIHQTNILIHPSYNSIIGYIEENNIHLEKNKQVEEACEYYQLKFIESKDL